MFSGRADLAEVLPGIGNPPERATLDIDGV
jgi:hypothetical protein